MSSFIIIKEPNFKDSLASKTGLTNVSVQS
uniref:Uncharacterized protein n=1 Tax=Tetranychus urticae TaxID=32264 RepID=T1KE12_TETUR